MSEFLTVENTGDSYLLRAHHARQLVEIECGKDLDTIVADAVNGADAGLYAGDLTVLDSTERIANIGYQEFTSAYRLDTLGTDGHNKAAFRDGHRAMLEKYVALEPDTPVILGVKVIDDTCGGCAFQRHCHNVSPNRTTTDRATLEVFSFIANDLGYGDRIDFVPNERITTDGATAKAVIKDIASSVGYLDTAITNFRISADPRADMWDL